MKCIFLICLCICFLNVKSELSNVCSNYFDYFFLDISNKCFYNKDVFSDEVDLLERIFPNYESHIVTTEDGYILTTHRLPRKNPKAVVILQHPITTNSIVYYLQGNESTALLFYNAGYEVWLPNNRGTAYSNKHVNMSDKDYKYWDFSFHEIGLYDYPAVFSYIANVTKRNDIAFVGHSIGVTASTIYASMKPEDAKKYIKIFIQMAPMVFLTHMSSPPLQLLSIFIEFIQFYCKILKWGSTFGNDSIFNIFYRIGAYRWNPFKYVYALILQALFGWGPQQTDSLLMNQLLSDMFKASSLKAFFHFFQIYKNGGTFRMFDYKSEKNMKLYNSSVPPEYPIENIQIPVYLIPGELDSMATVKDAEYLYNRLPKEVTVYGNYTAPKLNHLAFHFSNHRFELYKHVIDLLSSLY